MELFATKRVWKIHVYLEKTALNLIHEDVENGMLGHKIAIRIVGS